MSEQVANFDEDVKKNDETEESPPSLDFGYIVGVLDNGRPHFELVGQEKLNTVLLRGLQGLADSEVNKLTSDHDAMVRRSLQLITVGVKNLLDTVDEASEEEVGGEEASGETIQQETEE